MIYAWAFMLGRTITVLHKSLRFIYELSALASCVAVYFAWLTVHENRLAARPALRIQGLRLELEKLRSPKSFTLYCLIENYGQRPASDLTLTFLLADESGASRSSRHDSDAFADLEGGNRGDQIKEVLEWAYDAVPMYLMIGAHYVDESDGRKLIVSACRRIVIDPNGGRAVEMYRLKKGEEQVLFRGIVESKQPPTTLQHSDEAKK